MKSADKLIEDIANKSEKVIFLDALDEDIKAIENHKERINDLMEKCSLFKRVVITCRTQFFPNEEEIPVETGIAKIGPKRAGEKSSYEFWKLYLAPFDDIDINEYLRKRYPFWCYSQRKKAKRLVETIPLLSVRPMLLTHIPDLVKSNKVISYSYELYEDMIDAWLERESYWVNKERLRFFSEKIAVNIYSKRQIRGMERIPQDELKLISTEWNIELKDWQITGRSLLNRDAEGNYKFAHRSIMEYLIAYQILQGEQKCQGLLLSDQTKEFLVEMLNTKKPITLDIHNLLLDLNLFVTTLPITKKAIIDAKSALFSKTYEYGKILIIFLDAMAISIISNEDIKNNTMDYYIDLKILIEQIIKSNNKLNKSEKEIVNEIIRLIKLLNIKLSINEYKVDLEVDQLNIQRLLYSSSTLRLKHYSETVLIFHKALKEFTNELLSLDANSISSADYLKYQFFILSTSSPSNLAAILEFDSMNLGFEIIPLQTAPNFYELRINLQLFN